MTDGERPVPARPTRDELRAWLTARDHPDPDRWLTRHVDGGALEFRGDPPTCDGAAAWRQLLVDECDKLYNQAWCALEQIREAGDEDDVVFVVIDDFSGAIEQAYSLAPELAGEHLALMADYSTARLEAFHREMATGTDRAAAERIDSLTFWADNAAIMTGWRKALYRMVRVMLGETEEQQRRRAREQG